ncbi:MAG: helix-turn-helix domain-containing protein [Phycisphaerae bacterium]
MQNDLSTQQNPKIEQLLFTTRQTAALLNVSERTIWNLKRLGQLPVVRIRRSTRYDRRDILALIDQSKQHPNKETQ